MQRQGRRAVACILAAGGVLLSASTRAESQVISCPLGGGGDEIDRGFYVQNYTAGTIGTVTLTYYTAGTAGSYTLALTMHDGAYDGPVLGTQTGTFNLTASGGTTATYDFGGVPVPLGHTVAFVQTLVTGPGTIVYFDTGTCGLGDATCTSCPGVVETEATTAPLDTFRRGSVGLTIVAGEPIPALGAVSLAVLALAVLVAGVAALRRLGA